MSKHFWDWLDRPAVGVRDLAVFRIVYAVLMLTLLPTVRFAVDLPATAFAFPLGPFGLLPSMPPLGVIVALGVLSALALALLAVGWRTPAVSVVAGISLFVTTGLANSFGQIDHVALFALVPLVLAGSGWGAAFSLDAAAARTATFRPWLQRFLAFLIGISFLVAVVPKITSGWLSLNTQATLGHLLRRILGGDDTGPLADVVTVVQNRFLWEAVDWATVALELLVLVAVLNWRAFRVVLAVAVVFHLFVLLTLGIAFPSSVLAYGAFVAWDRWMPPRVAAILDTALGSNKRAAAVAAALAFGVAAWVLGFTVPFAQLVSEAAIVVIAGIFGLGLGAWAARRLYVAWTPESKQKVGTWAGRLVALGLVFVLPLQYLIAARFGEPYPALKQPGFSQVRLHGDEWRTNDVARITVTFDDGSTEKLRSRVLLPSPYLQQSVIFRKIFRGKARALQPDVVAWLEMRLAELFPGRTAVKLRVGWTTVIRDANDGHIISEKERYDVVVDLGVHP